ALKERGHAVWFACVRGDVLEAHVRAAGVTLVEELSLERTARPAWLASQIGTLRRVIQDRAIDVVHAHQTHDHWLAALGGGGPAARVARTVPHRRAAHAGPGARWLLKRTDALIAVSEGIAARLRATGAPAAQVTVVPGAVDAERFTPSADGAPVRLELGLGDAPAVGCVARVGARRGHGVLVRALCRAGGRPPP